MKKERFGNKGFTLIELLVGLIVIGLIVALLIPQAANVLKKAAIKSDATKVFDTQRIIGDRYSDYMSKFDGREPDDLDALVAAGMFKAKPTIAPWVGVPAVPAIDKTTYNEFITLANDDVVVTVVHITDLACKTYNSLFAKPDDIGETIPAALPVNGSGLADHDAVCISTGTPDDNTAILSIVPR